VPPEGHGRDGGSFVHESFFIAGSPEEAAHFAALRERVGDEMVDHLKRAREMMRHPRSLTDSEREVIRNAVAPVLRDLEVSGAIVPEVRYEAHVDAGRDGREGVHAWISFAPSARVPTVYPSSAAVRVWPDGRTGTASRRRGCCPPG